MGVIDRLRVVIGGFLIRLGLRVAGAVAIEFVIEDGPLDPESGDGEEGW